MLADLTPVIRQGIIDNTTQGTIRLLLWCVGERTPVSLEMPGNCLQDIAGCRVKFRLRGGEEDEGTRHRRLAELVHALEDDGVPLIAGDMTLSRRYPLPPSPKRLANILSLELFQGAKLRCLIETEEFECEVGLAAWQCSASTAGAQEIINMSALRDHVLANVAEFRGPSLSHLGESGMPACRWDYVLNRAEAYMIIAPSIRAKYAGRPGGHVAEVFVLDRAAHLQRLATRAEQGQPTAPARSHRWEVLDFMEPEHAKLARAAMHHPLFEATAELSQIIQRHVIAKLSQYADNKEVEQLLSGYSGIISHVLATIMLAREGNAQLRDIAARAESLCERMQRVIRHGEALRPKARAVFMRGAEELLARLREFLCTHRQ